jgi:hypothetical protein
MTKEILMKMLVRLQIRTSDVDWLAYFLPTTGVKTDFRSASARVPARKSPATPILDEALFLANALEIPRTLVDGSRQHFTS